MLIVTLVLIWQIETVQNSNLREKWKKDKNKTTFYTSKFFFVTLFIKSNIFSLFQTTFTPLTCKLVFFSFFETALKL